MWIPLNPQSTQMQTHTCSSNSKTVCTHLQWVCVCVCKERRKEISVFLCDCTSFSMFNSDLSASLNYYTTRVSHRGGKSPQLQVELCLTLVDNLSNTRVLAYCSNKHTPWRINTILSVFIIISSDHTIFILFQIFHPSFFWYITSPMSLQLETWLQN